MTQWEFDTILEVLKIGAPVFYERLGNALNNVVVERNKFEAENVGLKKKVEELTATKPEAQAVKSTSTQSKVVKK